MSLAHPLVLILVWVAMLYAVGLWAYDRWRREKLTRLLGELPVIGRVMVTSSPGRRLAKMILAGLALAAIVFTLARPQTKGQRMVESHGLDLVVAVDVSKSMMVDDVGPTAEMTEKKIEVSRLARAREMAIATVDELPGDRIAPVVFAGAASHFPLTEDHVVAEQFLSDLGPADLPAGSNLAEVLRVSRCLLRPDLYEDLKCAKIARRGHGGDPLAGESLDPAGAKSSSPPKVVEEKATRGKAIAIFTDGGDATPEALKEMAVARELGIAVFLIGVGTTKGGDVYEVDSTGKRTTVVKKHKDGTVIRSNRDDVGMTALAEAGGDAKRYIVAAETGEVDPMPLVDQLLTVDRGLAVKEVEEETDEYQPFLYGAFMLLVIEVAISTRRRRSYPEGTS